MERTRPDVSSATNLISRFTLQATKELFKYLVCVLCNLVSTKNLKLRCLPNKSSVPIEAFCDASWPSENDKKSTSGYIIKVYGNVVYYKTRRKQSIVAVFL